MCGMANLPGGHRTRYTEQPFQAKDKGFSRAQPSARKRGDAARPSSRRRWLRRCLCDDPSLPVKSMAGFENERQMALGRTTVSLHLGKRVPSTFHERRERRNNQLCLDLVPGFVVLRAGEIVQ